MNKHEALWVFRDIAYQHRDAGKAAHIGCVIQAVRHYQKELRTRHPAADVHEYANKFEAAGFIEILQSEACQRVDYVFTQDGSEELTRLHAECLQNAGHHHRGKKGADCSELVKRAPRPREARRAPKKKESENAFQLPTVPKFLSA